MDKGRFYIDSETYERYSKYFRELFPEAGSEPVTKDLVEGRDYEVVSSTLHKPPQYSWGSDFGAPGGDYSAIFITHL